MHKATTTELAARMDEAWLLSVYGSCRTHRFMNMANHDQQLLKTKKAEYGVIQAVGMTNKQLGILCPKLQGLIFTVGKYAKP